MDDIQTQAVAALQQEWGLQLPATVTEEELLRLLADKLITIIEKGPKAFFQLMYRLDISERKLNATFGDKDVATKIARLVYERQLQKAASRKAHHSDPKSDDPDLAW
jgi:hypothetical protein